MKPKPETQVSNIYAYKPVTETLATAGQPSEAQLQSVASAGFALVINLGLHDDLRYALQDEAGLVASLGMEYVHIPVVFSAPSEEQLQAFFTAMDKRRDRKTLVHCAANKRVTAFLGLYQAIRHEQSVRDAFALMKATWEPDAVWSGFIAQMLQKNGIAHADALT